MPVWLVSFFGGLAQGIGQGVGQIGGKIAEWVPGPAQYRRNKINDLNKQMFQIQAIVPFDNVKYDRLLEQRDQLEREALNSGT